MAEHARGPEAAGGVTARAVLIALALLAALVPVTFFVDIIIVLWPWPIAIAYLIPKELSFSCRFFWWALVAANVAGVYAGAEPRDVAWSWDSEFSAPRFRGGGAMVAIGLWALWTARSHLARVFRTAFGRRSGAADAAEPLSYRAALLGLVVTLGAMVYFASAAGCRAAVGLAIVGGIVGYYVVWALFGLFTKGGVVLPGQT